ncbi:MAG: HD domain-containing protein [Candidatus Nitrosotenuis sp.]
MVQDSLKATHANTNLDGFFKTVLKLKTVRRQGWIDKLGLANPESVADHSYVVSVMSMVLSDQQKLDTLKVLKMSLLHDLAESIVGDLTPRQASKIKKSKLESAAMKKILKQLEKPLQSEYWSLWLEYQQMSSPESKLLHEIDKLEMLYQAKLYQKSGYTKKQLSAFFKSTTPKISNKKLVKMIPRL